MLLLLGALIGLLAGLATGGRLRGLATVHISWQMLLVLLAALAVKELGIFGPLSGSDLTPWLFVASNVALVAWALWHRRQLVGVELVALGIALNVLVLAANGGHMPVSPALAHQGPPELARNGVLGQYVLAGPGTRLGWLGDVIQLPPPVSRVFPQAYSAGDLVSFVGMVVVVLLLTRRRDPAPEPRPIS
jgi:hypothetical protein